MNEADLVVDRIYGGGRAGNSSDDCLPQLLGVSNQGGFRYLGSLGALRMVVIVSSMRDLDWPDNLDVETGVFTYYGDNKKPGRELHETPRNGNQILRDLFELAHGGANGRQRMPPVLVFSNTGTYRDFRFRGLAVPSVNGMATSEDLVAVWRSTGKQRFQNYRARFTILDSSTVSRGWITAMQNGSESSAFHPPAWKSWIQSGKPKALKAPPTIAHRTRKDQLPDENDSAALNSVYVKFKDDPHQFEHFAAQIAQWQDPNVISIDVTQPSRDGGRDAIGSYRIGHGDSAIHTDFALEAKCYRPGSPVGVKDVARLIARLRHRQFGFLVTTSYLAEQAYKEIISDRHPVSVISGRDILETIRRSGIRSHDYLK